VTDRAKVQAPSPIGDPLISFVVSGLRAYGVPVSPAEVIDAHRAISLVGLTDRPTCLTALRATLVKESAHDAVFDLVVARLDAAGAEIVTEFVAQATAPEEVEFDGPSGDGPHLPDAAERVRVRHDHDDTSDGQARIVEEATDDAARSVGIDGVELANAGSESDADRRHHRLIVRPRSSAAFDLPWADRCEVERVARVFLRRHRHDARRWAPTSRGRPDMRRTVRNARRTGGVPLVLHERSRSRRRPKLVILADVSISVRPTATLALHAADALTRRSRGARLYVFVDHAADATAMVRRLAPSAVVAALMDGGVVDVGAASDYGSALRSAHDLIGSRLDRSTTILVFGDGRSNGAEPGFEVIDRWRRIARSVIWCTPEPRGAWPLGFGEMQGYADRVSQATTVRSVDDLAVALTA
jgi:uncharacterized protein with von Willebrand factor type A (vWA) domain